MAGEEELRKQLERKQGRPNWFSPKSLKEWPSSAFGDQVLPSYYANSVSALKDGPVFISNYYSISTLKM